MYYIFFIHPFADGHLGCFHVMATVNSAALNIRVSSVQSLSHVQFFATPWTAARQASLSITNSWSLLKLMSIKSVMPSKHLILSEHRGTLNLFKYSFVWMYAQSGIAGSYSIFSFYGTSILFSMVTAPIYTPNNSTGGFPFHHTLSSIVLSVR